MIIKLVVWFFTFFIGVYAFSSKGKEESSALHKFRCQSGELVSNQEDCDDDLVPWDVNFAEVHTKVNRNFIKEAGSDFFSPSEFIDQLDGVTGYFKIRTLAALFQVSIGIKVVAYKVKEEEDSIVAEFYFSDVQLVNDENPLFNKTAAFKEDGHKNPLGELKLKMLSINEENGKAFIPINYSNKTLLQKESSGDRSYRGFLHGILVLDGYTLSIEEQKFDFRPIEKKYQTPIYGYPFEIVKQEFDVIESATKVIDSLTKVLSLGGEAYAAIVSAIEEQAQEVIEDVFKTHIYTTLVTGVKYIGLSPNQEEDDSIYVSTSLDISKESVKLHSLAFNRDINYHIAKKGAMKEVNEIVCETLDNKDPECEK